MSEPERTQLTPRRVILVDDEPAARQNIKAVIAEFPELQIVAEATDGKSAIEQILCMQPDIVFMDIEMPEVTGFDVAQATRQCHYQLVFLTAYEQYALKAFETDAIDYLVKPAHPDLIARSIRKILRQQGFVLEQPDASESNNQLVLNDGNQQKIINYDHINYIEGLGRYRRVHLTEAGITLHGTDTILSDITLDSFSELLPKDGFLRLHRSYIVSRSQLLGLRLQSRRHFVKLAGTNTLIPVSRSFLSTLRQYINS